MAQYSIWYAVPYMLLLAAFYFLAYQEQRSIAAKRNRQTLHIWCGVLFLFFFGYKQKKLTQNHTIFRQHFLYCIHLILCCLTASYTLIPAAVKNMDPSSGRNFC